MTLTMYHQRWLMWLFPAPLIIFLPVCQISCGARLCSLPCCSTVGSPRKLGYQALFCAGVCINSLTPSALRKGS